MGFFSPYHLTCSLPLCRPAIYFFWHILNASPGVPVSPWIMFILKGCGHPCWPPQGIALLDWLLRIGIGVCLLCSKSSSILGWNLRTGYQDIFKNKWILSHVTSRQHTRGCRAQSCYVHSVKYPFMGQCNNKEGLHKHSLFWMDYCPWCHWVLTTL